MLSTLQARSFAETATAAETLKLAEDGRTDYAIYVAKDATPVEKHAADELAQFLHDVTGATFPISTEVPAGKSLLGVGAGAATELGAGTELNDLGADGILIRHIGKNLILSGGKDAARGTLYAVDTFLEDAVGVRWWAPNVTEVPTRRTLAIVPPDLRYKPVLEYRDPFIKCAFDSEYAAHNKINGPYRKLDAAHGSQIAYAGFVHTFYELVPPAEHFKTHPEWYSEIDGKRTSTKAQLCLTNPELREFVIGRVREWAEKNPETYLRDGPPASIISVSQNDWLGRCQCAECLKIEAEEGSPAGPLLRFVNAIAENLERDHPNIAIDTLAYMYTRKAPKITKPRKNVIIRLCSIECSFLQPLDSEANKSFREDVLAWSKICDRLYVWDYVVNFTHYLMPHPNLRVLAPNIRFLTSHGVKGILEQGNNRANGGEFEELKAWVLAKLLWNPNLNADALVDEFLRGYYGKAAPVLRQYIDLLHDRAEKSGYYLEISEDFKAPYLTLEFLAKADALLRSAVAAVADDDIHRKRVECTALATRYVFAVRWPYLQREAELTKQPWPLKESRDDVIADLRRVCEQSDITALFEDWSGDTTPHLQAFANRYAARGKPERPPGFEQVNAADFVDLQDECAQLWERPKKANWVADPLASDGKAVWMPGDYYGWNYYMLLSDASLKTIYDQEWTAYAVVRIDKVQQEGNAFSCGIYDQDAKKDLGQLVVKAGDVAGSKYHVYKIGKLKARASVYFWASPAKNENNVKGIWVDRFFMIRE